MADRLDVSGPAAPPRQNGELVFGAPWERRVFGLTMALVDAGAFAYETFRQELIRQIARGEAAVADEGWSYYRCWSRALEAVLRDVGSVDPDALQAKVDAFERRPHGHDH